jgi:hypothetical protein
MRVALCFSFGSFAVVVGAAGGVMQGCERGEEEGAFEFAVAGACGVFAADAAAGRWVTGAIQT